MDDLDKLIQALPEDEQRAVVKRTDELVTAHNLRELRALAGWTQEGVGTRFVPADTLRSAPPSARQ
jgi:hypothetical protein